MLIVLCEWKREEEVFLIIVFEIRYEFMWTWRRVLSWIWGRVFQCMCACRLSGNWDAGRIMCEVHIDPGEISVTCWTCNFLSLVDCNRSVWGGHGARSSGGWSLDTIRPGAYSHLVDFP
jgi:hypothetical protein